MARNTFAGYLRACGSGKSLNGATPAVLPMCLYKTGIDATQASADLGITLPKGAIVLDVWFNGKGTGGATPTFDLGTATDDDAFVAEGDVDGGLGTAVGDGTAGTSVQSTTALAADTAVYGGVGASAATGGTFDVYLFFIMSDDGALND